MTRIRLLPVLLFGLVSLLSIKLLGMALNAPAYKAPDPNASAFERTIKIAREGLPEGEIITGAIGKKEEAKEPTPEEKAALEKAKADFRAQAESEGRRIPPPNGDVAPKTVSSQERDLLERLKERRGEIDARDRELELRDSLLKLGERKLDEKIGELRSLENRAGKGTGSEEAKARYKPLVVMYESMKPKEAARVFDRLDLAVLVTLIDHMNPRKVSEILAAMEPANAEKLTVALARKAAAGELALAEKAPVVPAGDPELPRLPVQAPAPR